jgi:hypothetical protein
VDPWTCLLTNICEFRGYVVLALTRCSSFNAVRVPTTPADVPLAHSSDLHHIVVVRNDRYFKVDTKGRGKQELAEAFREVKKMADGKPGSGLGILTVDDRDIWTEVGHRFFL